jgi:NMD protein affecting ribosome stability and mRNA decay
MAELREIVDVKVEAKVYACDLCARREPCGIYQATKPMAVRERLPPGALECNNWSRPDGWEEIALPTSPRRIFCPDCAPVVAQHLEAALKTVPFRGLRR